MFFCVEFQRFLNFASSGNTLLRYDVLNIIKVLISITLPYNDSILGDNLLM